MREKEKVKRIEKMAAEKRNHQQAIILEKGHSKAALVYSYGRLDANRKT